MELNTTTFSEEIFHFLKQTLKLNLEGPDQPTARPVGIKRRANGRWWVLFWRKATAKVAEKREGSGINRPSITYRSGFITFKPG